MPTKKVTIKKAPVKGKLTAYTGDEYGSDGREPGWNKSKYAGQDDKVEALARKIGYVITPESTNEDFQKYILTNPEVARKFPKIKKAVLEMHRMYGEPIAGKYDNYFGKRWDGVFDAIDGYKDPKFADAEEIKKRNQLGQDYGISLDDLKKGKYNERGLPFSQITPELANFANAQNTYGYYTPDTTHWELNPQTLNIQPQLQDIDASMNALYNTTTGNPALDAAQKRAAYTEGLKAKQNAFGNKQNYDANARFETDKYNMAARTGEQNLDAQLASQIHNEYRAAAKDAAAYERINALQSIVKKQAQNKKNEAEKSLMLNNFYNNFEVDDDGNIKFIGDDIDFEYDPYFIADDEDATTTKATPTAVAQPIVNQPMTQAQIDAYNKNYRQGNNSILGGPNWNNVVPPSNGSFFKKEDPMFNPKREKLREFGMVNPMPIKSENGMMVDYDYDPTYMMPIRPIKKAKSLDKYFLRK